MSVKRRSQMMLYTTDLTNLAEISLDPEQSVRLWRDSRGLRCSWLRISARDFSGAAHSAMQLWLVEKDGAVTTFDIPVGDAGQTDQLLYVRPMQPVAIELRLPTGAGPLHLHDLRIKRRGWLSTIWSAFQASPKAVLASAQQYVLGRKLRARNTFMSVVSRAPGIEYGRWLQRTAPSLTAEQEALAGDAEVVSLTKRIVVLRHAEGKWCNLQSPVTPQPACESLLMACRSADADWLWLLDQGDHPSDGGERHLAKGILDHPEAVAIYGDYDEMDAGGRRHNPHFGPDWNETLYWAFPYFRGLAVRVDALNQVLAGGIGGETYDAVVLKLLHTVPATQIAHVPRILTHRRPPPTDDPTGTDRCELLRSCLDGDGAEVETDDFGHCRVRWPLSHPLPRVSLIVPTKDRIDLLRPCIESLLTKTDYPDLELVIADNGSSQPDALSYLEQLRQRPDIVIVDCPGPFNFAAINNRAVGFATGSVLGLINNDIEAVEPGWLREMVAWAIRPNVGAVGARLLYPSGLIQHAGIVLGLGGTAGHPHRFYKKQHPGYMNRLQCHQEVSAVTAACLIVEKKKFEHVGGFDAENFAVNFNDVDLCLRLGKAGFKTIWTPYSELLHKETASRSLAQTPSRLAQFERERSALVSRWQDKAGEDPHYNPNLSRHHEAVVLGN